ncbi:MAG: HAD family hydrolase [Treponema sp.]|nr:HAD family hydrolase [Treponema sp.]
MKFKCVIFDLDGTLVDTIADIAASMNRALTVRGFPAVAPEAYRDMVGWGIRRLAALALPSAAREDGRLVDKVAADAAVFYAEKPLVHSKPYPGLSELIGQLRQKKIKTAVLTNKPDSVARLVVDGLFASSFFDIIQGDVPGAPRKPDPASTWEIILELGSTPRETIFVGDSEIDMETALASGCHAVAVSWGFRSREVLAKAGAERIIDLPEELLSVINDL